MPVAVEIPPDQLFFNYRHRIRNCILQRFGKFYIVISAIIKSLYTDCRRHAKRKLFEWQIYAELFAMINKGSVCFRCMFRLHRKKQFNIINLFSVPPFDTFASFNRKQRIKSGQIFPQKAVCFVYCIYAVIPEQIRKPALQCFP